MSPIRASNKWPPFLLLTSLENRVRERPCQRPCQPLPTNIPTNVLVRQCCLHPTSLVIHDLDPENGSEQRRPHKKSHALELSHFT